MGLRTSSNEVSGWYERNLYGPLENGRRPYLALVSWPFFTGEAAIVASICSKSPLGRGSLKTMVPGPGVSIAVRPFAEVSLYGPR